jgi:hypothetical protein
VGRYRILYEITDATVAIRHIARGTGTDPKEASELNRLITGVPAPVRAGRSVARYAQVPTDDRF